MSWPHFSDTFGDECWTLSDAAFRLHTEGLCWNGRKLLDCRIPKEELRRFAKVPEAVDELLDCGYWTEDDEHYVIRHHAEHQRSRERAIALQERNRQNGRLGGRPRKDSKNPNGFPDGNPDRNPKGEERRGEEISVREGDYQSWVELAADPKTGEIVESVGAGSRDAATGLDLSAMLFVPLEQHPSDCPCSHAGHQREAS